MFALCTVESISVAPIVKVAAIDSAEGFLVIVIDVGAGFLVVLRVAFDSARNAPRGIQQNWDISKYELPPYASQSGVSGGRSNAVSSLGGFFGGR